MTSLKLIFFIFTFSLIGLKSCGNKTNDTKIVSIGYHSDNCDDCNTLKSKMKKMNRKFLLSPIVFIKYDHTTNKSKTKAEEKLQKLGFLEIAQKEEGLKHVVLYDSKSKEQIVRLDYNDSVEVLEQKISGALSKNQ
jgi:hypothetical protein